MSTRVRRSIVAAGACAAVLGAAGAVASSGPPAHSSPVGHWQGSMQYASGGAGADIVDIVIRGSGRHMRGTLTYPGNPCHGPLRSATRLGANRWRFRYAERSHNLLACPSSGDRVQVMRVGASLFVRDLTTSGARIVGLLGYVP